MNHVWFLRSVVLCTLFMESMVLSLPPNPGQNPGQKSGQNPGKKSGQKPGQKSGKFRFSMYLPTSLYLLCFPLPQTLVKNLAKNLVKHLVKNLAKSLVKNLVKIWAQNLGARIY